MSETRKIAAILVSDVVGYSRLAGADEDRILARLRALRSDLIDPTIAVHNGRVVKRTGDGSLVEFRSVVDAVRCAIEVQNAMVERNAGLPAERRIEFRVGIHLGDVVEENDGDLMGDGVNIAARLEGICEPGSICLSEQAYWQVKARLDLAINDRGAVHLKNITDPVHVYSLQVGVRPPPQPAAPADSVRREEPLPRLALPDKPSIAVLPFQNMSGDAEQEYFADGMVEDIITGLSRIKWLFVIARNSSFVYKGKAVDIRQVGANSACAMCWKGACARRAIGCASAPSSSKPRPARICGQTGMMARWRMFSICRTRSPTRWSALSSRACNGRRSSAPGKSVRKISTPTTSICGLFPTWQR